MKTGVGSMVLSCLTTPEDSYPACLEVGLQLESNSALLSMCKVADIENGKKRALLARSINGHN